MKPTYEELTHLNPRLKSRSKEEIESLIKTIIKHGYIWWPDKSLFYNPKFEVSIRTEGLDLFTAENFKESQRTILNSDNIKTTKASQINAKQQLLVSFILLLLSILFFVFSDWKWGILFLVTTVTFWIYKSKQGSKIRKKESKNDK